MGCALYLGTTYTQVNKVPRSAVLQGQPGAQRKLPSDEAFCYAEQMFSFSHKSKQQRTTLELGKQ